jgi:hypothetical protein
MFCSVWVSTGACGACVEQNSLLRLSTWVRNHGTYSTKTARLKITYIGESGSGGRARIRGSAQGPCPGPCPTTYVLHSKDRFLWSRLAAQADFSSSWAGHQANGHALALRELWSRLSPASGEPDGRDVTYVSVKSHGCELGGPFRPVPGLGSLSPWRKPWECVDTSIDAAGTSVCATRTYMVNLQHRTISLSGPRMNGDRVFAFSSSSWLLQVSQRRLIGLRA